MYLKLNKQKPATSWRDQADMIKAARKEYRQYYSIMTEYERQTAEREISEVKAANMPNITNGILREYHGALNKFKAAHLRVEDERKKEIAGWDAQRLSAEMQTYEKLIDQAVNTPSGAFDGLGKNAKILETTYREAFDCGDKYKARAIAEVLKSAPAKYRNSDPEAKKMIEHLAAQSERDMIKVRNTEGLKEASQNAEANYKEYLTAREMMIKEVNELGEPDPMGPFASGPFAQALKQVQSDKQGNLHFYNPEAPEVTGVLPVKEG